MGTNSKLCWDSGPWTPEEDKWQQKENTLTVYNHYMTLCVQFSVCLNLYYYD